MNYDSVEEFSKRTQIELADTSNALFKNDMKPPIGASPWIISKLERHKGGSVIEFGSGLGIWAPIVREAGCNYIGIEPVLDRYKFACKTFGPYFLHENALTVKLEKQYDAAFFCTVLQHLPLEDAIEALQNACAHVKPGGNIYLYEGRIFDLTDEECDFIYHSAGHAHHMFPKSLETLQYETPGISWVQESEIKWVLSK